MHAGIRPDRLEEVRAAHPDAEVLVHPECGCAGQLIHAMGEGEVSAEGLHIASTERMIQLVRERPVNEFIIATETGIMHRMQKDAPDKQFLAADPEAVCAFMKTITLRTRGMRCCSIATMCRCRRTSPPGPARRSIAWWHSGPASHGSRATERS